MAGLDPNSNPFDSAPAVISQPQNNIQRLSIISEPASRFDRRRLDKNTWGVPNRMMLYGTPVLLAWGVAK